MRIVTTLPQDDLRRVPAAAKQAEADGYTGVITMENRNNPFLPHVAAALATDTLEVGTAIAIAFARSPMVVANMSWDLQIASSGRFTLGLGPQVRAHNERRFSVPWTPPVPRLREYVQALRAIWRCWEKGEKLNFRGDHYTFTLMTPAFTPSSQHMRMTPILMAGVGEHSLRLAGEQGDGVLLHPFCTRRYIEEEVLPRVREGLAKSGRSLDHFEVNGGGFVVTGKDEEAVRKVFEWTRERVAFYGSTPAYWPVLALHGLSGLGEELNRLSKEGKWKEMTALIADDLVHEFAAVGTHDVIAKKIAERFGGLSDCVSASPNQSIPSTLPPNVIAEIRAVPTRFKGFKTEW